MQVERLQHEFGANMKVKPISPSIAVTSAEDKALSDSLKSHINSYLSSEPWSAYALSNGRWLDCSIITSYGSTPEAVIKAYSKAGWNVKRIDDQRDGASLRFLPPPKETT